MANNFPIKHGRMLITPIADPAPGALFTYTVSPRLIEQLYSIHFLLDTAAGGSARRTFFQIDDSVNVIANFTDTIDIAANTIARQTWLINAPAVLNTAPGVIDLSTHFIPPDYIMPLGGTLTQFTTNIAGGDQVSAIIVVTKVWSRT